MLYRTVFSFSLLAGIVSAETLTTEDAIERALANNPEIAAIRELVQETQAQGKALWQLPNPELETEFALGQEDTGRLEIGLSQSLPRNTRRRLESRVAEETVHLAEYDETRTRLLLSARVRIAVLDLATAQARTEQARQQQQLAKAFADSQAEQAAAGQIASLDADLARLIAEESRLRFEKSQAQQEATAITLCTLLGQTASADLSVSYDLSLPSEDVAIPPPGVCADVLQAEARIKVAEAQVALARITGRSDDIKLGVFVEGEQARDPFGSLERDAMLGFRFSLPLPVRNTATHAVTEKQATRRRMVLEHQAKITEANNRNTAGEIELKTAYQAARNVESVLLPKARAILASTESAYARGEVPLNQLFQARERLSQIEQTDLDTRHAYHRAVIRRTSSACCLSL